MNIIDKLEKLGYKTINANWYDRINNWNSWYKGNVEKFHNYRVYNGMKNVKCTRYSLGMAKKVCEDWANLLMNEKVKITLEGEKEQAYIDDVFTANNFEVNMNELQEKGAVRGTYAIVPMVGEAEVNERGEVVTGGGIRLEYVTAEHIFPLAWNGRDITECAFASVTTVDGHKYLYMQLHVIEGNEYVIKNALFRADNDTLQDVELTEVKGFENIPTAIMTHSDKPQFVIGRYNIANNIEDNNPMGIAVFANAIDILKGVDIAYDSYVNEFVLGKKRVMVKPSAVKKLDGEDVFDPSDMAYYVLPEDMTDGTVIHEIDMKLRTAEHTQGLQDHLNMLSAKCGFGEQHYKFDQGNVSTATQIISENSEMFRTIKKHEIVLSEVLKELCHILLRLGNNYNLGDFNEEANVTIDFDDSIIENKDIDFERDMRLLNAGIMADWEFRSKWMGESPEDAKKNLPRMEDMNTEEEKEVE